MIREVHVKTIEDLMPLLTDQEYRPDLGRNRSAFVYRGMTNADFRMVTSLRRNCRQLQASLEPAILKNFAKYAVIEDPSIAQSVWRQMIMGQHHGLPTRLLDWTQSPLVALHFSVSEDSLEQMEEHDCVIWRMDITQLHSLLPEKYQQVMREFQAEVFSVDMLTRAARSLEEYDRDMGNSAMVVIEPPSIDPRIITLIGLSIANSFTALSGCLLALSQRSCNIDIGSGMVTIALASLLIGRIFSKERKLTVSLFCAVLGTFIFRSIYALALRLNMPAFMLKLVSAFIVALAISIPYLRSRLPLIKRRRMLKKEAA